jgi:hypothetical protein
MKFVSARKGPMKFLLAARADHVTGVVMQPRKVHHGSVWDRTVITDHGKLALFIVGKQSDKHPSTLLLSNSIIP